VVGDHSWCPPEGAPHVTPPRGRVKWELETHPPPGSGRGSCHPSQGGFPHNPCRFSHRLLLHVLFMPVTLFFSKASVCFCSCASRRLIALSSFITSPHGLFVSMRPLLSCFALLIVCPCATAPTTSYRIVLCVLFSFCDPLMLCAPHTLYGNPCCFTLARFCSGPGLVCPARACVEPAYGVSGTF